ncbi:hypothetical protein D3C76_1501480 [compost metagenome]
MTPQQINVVDSNVKEYKGITKSEYTYQQTKNISKESLVQEYDISQDDILNFQKYNTYKPGNSDPFTPASDVGTTNPDTSKDDTTNSNGGNANPDSSNK